MIEFVKGFLKRDGLFVFVSGFLIKLFGILVSIFVVRLLPIEEYGYISFSISVISILAVFGGLGSNWSLLRFGSLLSSFNEKYQMYRYSIVIGFKYTVPLILIIIISSFFLPPNLKDTRPYLILLSFSLLTNFNFELLKSYFRVIGKNKIFSKSNIVGSFILLFLSLILSYFLKGYGYVLALVLSPLLAFLFFFKHIFFTKRIKNTENNREFFKYGLFTGFGAVVNESIILLGPIIAGYLNAEPEELALLKVATIIPFNLLMIPLLIMTTDFVHFSKNSNNAKLLINYYKQYLKTISVISVIPFLILLFFNKYLLITLFGSNYSDASDMSFVLIVGVFFAFLFRIPNGNILAAVGKANWNVYHAFFWFIMFIPMSIYSYKLLGIIGIAYCISGIFIISGFISFTLLLIYLKSIQKNI